MTQQLEPTHAPDLARCKLAIATLQQSEHGRESLAIIGDWIKRESLTGLDGQNQTALANVIMGLWGPQRGTVADMLREAIDSFRLPHGPLEPIFTRNPMNEQNLKRAINLAQQLFGMRSFRWIDSVNVCIGHYWLGHQGGNEGEVNLLGDWGLYQCELGRHNAPTGPLLATFHDVDLAVAAMVGCYATEVFHQVTLQRRQAAGVDY